MARPSGRRLGLRARITLSFALGAMLLSTVLAVATFTLTRSSLLKQREDAALTQVFSNASTVRGRLPVAPDEVGGVLQSLQAPGTSHPLVLFEGSWFPLDPTFGREAVPEQLRAEVLAGQPAQMRYDLRGTPQLGVGIPLPADDAAYFEIVELTELEDTLRQLTFSLVGAGLVTTLAGAALGWWVSKRTLRPLADVSVAAEQIAGGRLDTRLEAEDDPDLRVLVSSFNGMAAALQQRVERDARFASDVSHELRSPLMTLTAAVHVLDTRRGELPERARAALDLMVDEVHRFQLLVEDLLEISRFDAGAQRLELDDVRLAEFVMQAVGASASLPKSPSTSTPTSPASSCPPTSAGSDE